MELPDHSIVYASTPIYPNSYFTWGEATKNCSRPLADLIIDGQLIICAIDIQKNILNTAHTLDRVRRLLGARPLLVNSWYRPAHINRRVGGSKYSRHQYGDAVDIRSDYHSAYAIYKLLNKVHVGGLGRYYSFVHIDWRNKIARWSA